MWRTALCLLCFCVGGAQTLVAEETAALNGKQGKQPPGSSLVDSLSLTSRHEPIRIHSRELEFRYEEKRIVYRGDVVAVQGDVTMKSDLLTVTYEDVQSTPGAAEPKVEKVGNPEKAEEAKSTTSMTAKQRLKEIVAEGRVEITSGDRRATGKKAVFNETQRTVVLSGDAVVQEGGNQVTGERVTVYLDEKRSVVDSGGSDRRVQMVLIPEREGEVRKEAKKP